MRTNEPLPTCDRLASSEVATSAVTVGHPRAVMADTWAGDEMWWMRVDEYVAHKGSRAEWGATSVRVCGQILRHFIRSVDVAGFDADSLAGFVNSSTVAPATRCFRWTITRGFLAWAGVGVAIPPPPAPRRVPKPLADVDVAALLAVCGPRDAAFISLAVCEGLRSGELHRLDLGDVDLEGRIVFVQGKGGHQRWVPLTDASWERIRRYCDELRGWHPGALIGRLRDAERVAATWYWRRSTDLMVAAGIKRPGVSLHSLRHTAATRLWMETSDLFMTQQMLGHANIATTARYVACRPTSQMRDAMNRVST